MSDYKLVNLVDAGLEDISTQITLPVISSTNSNTFQSFTALTVSPNQITFNVQIPSLGMTFKRNVLIQTKCRLRIDFADKGVAEYWQPNQQLFAYGLSNALQAFPLNSSFATIQAQINDSVLTLSSKDVLSALLKMSNYEELAKTNSLCPSLIDSFYNDYRDGIGSNSNVLGNYANSSYAKEYQPRGCFPAVITDLNGNVLPFVLHADADGTNPYPSIYIEFQTTEPLLFLSPFSSGAGNNQANFVGINAMTMTMTILANAGSYMMSNASYGVLNVDDGKSYPTISNVSLVEFKECQALFNFQTVPPQLYDKVLPKNVVNFNQYTCYPTSNNAPIPSAITNPLGLRNILQSTNLQLNQIPSKILIYVKAHDKTSYESNSFMKINKIDISFAGKAGLLTGCNEQQLYNLSVKNGLQENFYEFSGLGMSSTLDRNGDVNIQSVPTIGSVLVIDPASDLSLEPQYSNMSSGQFNFSFSITVTNQAKYTITPTIYILCVNSGLFITENGKSTFTTGMLSQEQVLDTKRKEAITDTHTYNTEIVGGSIENIAGIHKHVKKMYSRNSEKEKELDKEAGEVVPEAGAMSSGAVHHKKKVHKYTK
jgi:hypothetical protein